MTKSVLQTYADDLRNVTEQLEALIGNGQKLLKIVQDCEDDLREAETQLRAHIAYTDNIKKKREDLIQRMGAVLNAVE